MTSVVHFPAPTTTDVDRSAFHWKPGARYTDSTAGLPSAAVFEEVPSGEQVCYLVHGANPLIYSYSMTVVDVPVAPSADVADIAKQLALLFPTTATKAVGQPTKPGVVLSLTQELVRAREASVAAYRAKVRRLGVEFLDSAAKIKSTSDRQSSFASTYAADSGLWKGVEETNSAADSIYKQLPAASQEELKEARALQQFAYAQLAATHKAVEAAAAQMQPGREALMVCKAMPTGRTRFGLIIVPRPDVTPLKPARKQSTEKEGLAQFTLDPEYVERFRVAPGLFVAGLFGQDRDVGVSGGKLTIEPTGRTYSRVGMFAMGRATDYVWPTLGVAKSEGSSSVDVFAGVNLRAGNFIFGPELSVGIGVAWMDVPVGAGSLKAGDALPDNKKLDDVITRERHFGLGLTFTISGLTVGKSDKPADTSPK